MNFPATSKFASLSRPVAAALCVLALAVAVLVFWAAGPGSGLPTGPDNAGACGPVPVKVKPKSRFGKAYAQQYKKQVVILVRNTGHFRIQGLMVQLYTFDGFRLGGSGRAGGVGPRGTRGVKVKLNTGLQAGKITVVVKGHEPGCSIGEADNVVAFHACEDKLPVKFPGVPGGTASDYGDFLSVTVQPVNGQVIRQPHTELFSFDGEFVGHDINHYSLIYGKSGFDNKLTTPLRPGGYTMLVRGRLNQPATCGAKTAQVTMSFK